jgi:hypothetical protein
LITFLLTLGQESDISQAQELMETGAIRRRTGHVRLRPQCMVANKGYTSRALIVSNNFVALPLAMKNVLPTSTLWPPLPPFSCF